MILTFFVNPQNQHLLLRLCVTTDYEFCYFLRLRLLMGIRFSWVELFASFSKLLTVHFISFFVSLSLTLYKEELLFIYLFFFFKKVNHVPHFRLKKWHSTKPRLALEALCYYRLWIFYFLRLRLLMVIRFSWVELFASFSKLITVHFIILYISLSLY